MLMPSINIKLISFGGAISEKDDITNDIEKAKQYIKENCLLMKKLDNLIYI